MSADLKAILKQAQDFIAVNLAECCAEELEWQSTSLLCDGKLREAAAIYGKLDKTHALPLAQSETARQAMRRAALASQSVAVHEPVAYCVPNSKGKPEFGKGWMFSPVPQLKAQMPLYAAPQPPAIKEPAQRRARKVGGSYQADGTIVSEFRTLAGEQRFVFEFSNPAGMLHIFGPQQVESQA